MLLFALLVASSAGAVIPPGVGAPSLEFNGTLSQEAEHPSTDEAAVPTGGDAAASTDAAASGGDAQDSPSEAASPPPSESAFD